MVNIRLVPPAEFRRIEAEISDPTERLQLIGDMCRINTLNAVKNAGSGHLGSSYSAMDIVVWLYWERTNTLELGVNDPNRDIYFSSKGHDVPGLYSVLYAHGVIDRDRFLRLRRHKGLDGHPDVNIPGIEANTGSLGMGISKGRGMAWAKRAQGFGGEVLVLTGDGEFQEGQIYESLQTTAQQGVPNLTVIVDHNKFQTDRPVSNITDLKDIVAKVQTFGWHVERCDGHDFDALAQAFHRLDQVTERPRMLVADTIKGRGISFMEPTDEALAGREEYPWHSGAPADDPFERGQAELVSRVNETLKSAGLDPIRLEEVGTAGGSSSGVTREYVADAYGKALVDVAARRADVMVLDGDLAMDCRVRDFEVKYPDRFVENGIAEQDMVSMAGGLARHGMLPVVNTFASFLAARANEQIYNNATEGSRIIYANHYAGLIPAGPGKSHQSVRDIALLGSLPNMVVIQPCNAAETEAVTRYCIEDANDSCVIRLAIGPSPRTIELPDDYELTPGRGVALTPGDDAILFGYGPVMLHEALTASERLREVGFGLKVVNLPWLNRLDVEWLQEMVTGYDRLFVLEDHATVGGLGDRVARALTTLGTESHRTLQVMGVDGFPECGTPPEALMAHRLDGDSLARRILADSPLAQELEARGAAAGAYTTEAPQ